MADFDTFSEHNTYLQATSHSLISLILQHMSKLLTTTSHKLTWQLDGTPITTTRFIANGFNSTTEAKNYYNTARRKL